MSALAALRLKSPVKRSVAASRSAATQAGGTYQKRAIETKQEVHDPLFARLENARAGDAHGDPGCLHAFDGRPQAVEIQVIERDAGRAEIERGVKLIRAA